MKSRAQARAWGDAHPRLRLALTVSVSVLAALLVMAFLSSIEFSPGDRVGFLVSLAFGTTLLAWSWYKGPKSGVEPHALTALQVFMVFLTRPYGGARVLVTCDHR